MVQRYKVGYYTDEWGMSSSTPCLLKSDNGYAVKFEDYEQLSATITEQAARIKALEGALRDACVALTRQTRQTHRWQNLYGGYYPKWIPPVHDVIVAELSQQAISAINELIGE